jgi:uncharacterized lipoprotein YddW (UPF0748 family)
VQIARIVSRPAVFLAVLVLIGSCSILRGGAGSGAPPLTGELPPAAPREFRAAWVSSVANIDWPSRKDLSVAQQQAEIITILDQARALNLNALILQVRTSADALYPSALEPWSEYLTGVQGKAPDPLWDPLQMWIQEAHRRGIELHAWFNPYRARHSAAQSPPSATHVATTNPGIVKSYGGYLWLDPGEPAAAQRTLDVITDVVRRYDVDGVHIDDYFYPYPVENAAKTGELDFPDEPSWQRYRSSGGQLARADWRRQNVNQLIEAMHAAIHREKPWVRFGISPFGIGRPDRRPPGIAGFSQYDKLYADAELWLEKGWLDYLTPQLYWPINQEPQAFGVLLDYWAQQNTHSRHLWPGLFTSRIDGSAKSWTVDEITRQIDLIRTRPAAGGHVHFSMVALMQDRKGIATKLKAGAYAAPALVPASPWLAERDPAAPLLHWQAATIAGQSGTLKLKPADPDTVWQYAVWRRHGTTWRFSVQPATDLNVDVKADASFGAVNAVVVSAIDRLGNESPRVAASLNR